MRTSWKPTLGPLPSVFVSHGTPMLALAEEDAFATSLVELAAHMPAPAAVVVMSAHAFGGKNLKVDAASRQRGAHDYAGFPKELYDVSWAAPGDPDLAVTVVNLLQSSFPAYTPQLTASGNLDHGAWMPLRWMDPQGHIPVVPLLVPADATPRDALKMGTLLAPLREQGVLILGTGGAVHNLSLMEWHGKHAPPAPFAAEFEAWVLQCLITGKVEDLARYEELAPGAAQAHPSHDHFLPLLFALGAALPGDVLQVFNKGIQYKSLSMLSFSLVQPRAQVLSVDLVQ